MRSTQDWSEKHLTIQFCRDERGGCVVECPCGHEFNTVDYSDYCPVCKQEIVYPGWAEW